MLERMTNAIEQPVARLAVLREDALERAGVRKLQAFQRDLNTFGQARPLVIALLLWVGWRAYRAERRRLKRQP